MGNARPTHEKSLPKASTRMGNATQERNMCTHQIQQPISHTSQQKSAELELHLKIAWKIFGTSCEPAQVCLPKKNGLRILEPLPHINFSFFGDRKSRSSQEEQAFLSQRPWGAAIRGKACPLNHHVVWGMMPWANPSLSKASSWLIRLGGPSQLSQDTVNKM